jgi:hypothetical protein
MMRPARENGFRKAFASLCADRSIGRGAARLLSADVTAGSLCVQLPDAT